MAAMSPAPKVSVVMSVYNGAARLQETLASVLGQLDCDFEFIVVDDGSTDGTAELLQAQARDEPRLRVIRQENSGLTLALARGCREARGEYVARQDASDLSLPGRLAAQVEHLDLEREVVMTACAVRFAGPRGEALYDLSHPGVELENGLGQLDVAILRGPPHHGATMFRREDYVAVGGYRLPFVVAQDIDLWLRLAERGRCLGTAELGYEARMEVGSISSRRRNDQIHMSELAIACARARRGEGSEQALLQAFEMPPVGSTAGIGRAERARFHYFVASCLRRRDREGARRYFRLALRDNPFHLKALLRCLSG